MMFNRTVQKLDLQRTAILERLRRKNTAPKPRKTTERATIARASASVKGVLAKLKPA